MINQVKYSLAVMLVILGTQSKAMEDCDLMGSLEADPLSVSAPVAFADIKSQELIEACTAAINKQNADQARFYLLRARGYLRAGYLEDSVNDITQAHEMGYAAATFAKATLFHFGEAVPADLVQAALLYEQAYENGVTWAARALSILYDDLNFENYNPELAKEWRKKFGSN